MPPLRAVLALIGLASLALTGCAAALPWPPVKGSCIEADKRPGRRRSWNYRIAGETASRREVERTVYDTPDLHAKVGRYERVSTAAPILILGGDVAMVGGFVAALGTHDPRFSVISVAGLAATVAGVVLLATQDDPLRGAIVTYNAKARGRGVCDDRPGHLQTPGKPPYEVPAEPALHEGLPVLPARGWTP